MFAISFRIADVSDLQEMQQLFVDTVTIICCKYYNDEQIHAWTSGVEDTQRWLERLNNQHVLLAIKEDRITDFGTIKAGTYIRYAYPGARDRWKNIFTSRRKSI